MPSTLRTELQRLSFDFEGGTIVYQGGSGHQRLHPPRQVEWGDSLLDERFSNGTGSMDISRVIASDREAVYLVHRNLHGTSLAKVYHDAQHYVDTGETLPYPED